MSLQTAIANADPSRVVMGGTRLGQSNQAFSFLDPSSPLITTDTQRFIEDCLRRAPTPGDANHLEEFLALSSCCHLFSGWRYLGKACFSLLDGARNTAIHLGYYAELRAAMSLLAANGVGILNTCHFSIDSQQTVTAFGTLKKNQNLPAVKNDNWPTHKAVWKAIHEWCQLPSVSAALLDRFSVLGRDGNTWVRAVSGTSITSVSWAANWAIDLKSLHHDSDVRNNATYRADLDPKAYLPVRDTELQFVRLLSLASVSEAPGALSGIDLYLAEDLCRKAAKTSGISESKAWTNLFKFVLDHEGLDATEANEVVRLVRDSKLTHGGQIVVLANRLNNSATGVLARAFLLLRMSTLYVRELWKEIRLMSPGGNAVWQDSMLRVIAENSHLKDPASTEDILYEDLILDQEIAIEEIDSWCNKNVVSGRALWDQSTGIAGGIRELCQLERVGLWAILP